MIDDPDIPAVGPFLAPDRRSTRWCVWAPKAGQVELVLGPGPSERRIALEVAPRGFHVGETEAVAPGRRYQYALDGTAPLPDPASRWQPEGAFGPSAVLYPDQFEWDEAEAEAAWRGIARPDLVFYELHVGTFTREGTFDAVIPRLASLRELGITAIELMPVGQFPGRFGWGYDGVFPFAVQNTYGGPEGLKRLIEACHRVGLAVVLDVVYNHFGSEGAVFSRFGPYFNDRYPTDWGPAINYDGPGSDPVRRFLLENVRMWVRDYHVDGLRLDAADQIFDRSATPILTEAAALAHAEASRRGWPCHLFAETDLNDAPRFLRPAGRGGYGLDGHWNDDFHHAAHVALTGFDLGYFRDFTPGPAALAKTFEQVFVNNGTYSAFRDRRHGAPATEFPGDRFVAFIQNHDQVANASSGRRTAALLSPAQARLAAGLLLLAPRLPLLFQGEEYGETNSFHYFRDTADPELARAVREGRKREFAYFQREEEPPDPISPGTRDQAVLSWSWDEPSRAGLRRLYQDLLRLRRTSPTLRDFRHPRARLHADGAVLEIIRGDDDGAVPELRTLFNLSASPQVRPDDVPPGPIVLRSETAAYGAAPDATNEGPVDRLRPHEFLIIGRLGDQDDDAEGPASTSTSR